MGNGVFHHLPDIAATCPRIFASIQQAIQRQPLDSRAERRKGKRDQETASGEETARSARGQSALAARGDLSQRCRPLFRRLLSSERSFLLSPRCKLAVARGEAAEEYSPQPFLIEIIIRPIKSAGLRA